MIPSKCKMPTSARPAGLRRPGGYSTRGLVLILILLVALVVALTPKAKEFFHSAKDNQLTKQLRHIRQQINLYRIEHGGRGPHLDENGRLDTGNLMARLTGMTTPTGALTPEGPCGPYLKTWPTNPFAAKGLAREIKFGWAPVSPRDGSSGWYYNIYTCLLSPNTPRGAKSLDPPLLAYKPKAAHFTAVDKGEVSGLRLTGIMRGPAGAIAFINDTGCRVGETFMGATVKAINKYSVELEIDGRTVALFLKGHSAEESRAGTEAELSAVR